LGVASLVLGILSIVFGILPLLPVGGPATLFFAAVGLPLGAIGLCLGLWSRSEALLTHRAVGLHTAALSTAVVGTLICLIWVGSLFYAQRKVHQMVTLCQKDPLKCPKVHLPSLRLTPEAARPPTEAPPHPL
jgi:hypothetical protein